MKVLDFGLAKMLDGSGKSGGAGRAGGLENSPTLSVHATMQAVILGTAAYMSPEQARGKTVDRRADIWAFGVVLYEMLTGKRAFEGEEISDVLAALLRQEIDTTALPAETPDAIRRLLARCLTRDPKQRLADASTIRLDIDQALKEPAPASTRNSALKMPSDSTGRWLEPNRLLFVEQGKLVARPLDLGRGEFSGGHGAFSISTHGLVAYRPQLADQESHLVWLDRTGAPAGPPIDLAGPVSALEISPDGTRLAVDLTINGNRDIWLSDLERGGLTRFTFDAAQDGFPVWSPDGEVVPDTHAPQPNRPTTVCGRSPRPIPGH